MHNALFIGWGMPVRGRETQATKVFGEWAEMLGSWKSKGRIEGFTPVFLAPRGGELRGFFLVTGEPSKLTELHQSDEMRRAITRAEIVVDDVGVALAITGDEIGKQMALWNASLSDLAK